ncbi:hypothetical protein [Ignatzschineria sp. LJL83]
MKKGIIILIFIITSLFAVTRGEINLMDRDNKDVVVSYFAGFKFNYMYCTFNINGLLLGDSLSKQGDWQPSNIMWTEDIGGLFQEGENLIEMEGIQMPKTPQDGSDPYCEISITASAENIITGKTSGKEVTHLRISYDAEGNFTVADSRKFPTPSVTNEANMVELDRRVLNNEELNKDVLASRTLYIYHPHRIFSWTEAKPFEATPENIDRLWSAYKEMEDAMVRQDEAKLKKIFLTAAKETDQYHGYEGEESQRWEWILKWFKENWAQYNGHRPAPIDKSRYNLQIANHGKLFRLVDKGSFLAAPLIYKTIGESSRFYNFYFTEVDGVIRPAVLP